MSRNVLERALYQLCVERAAKEKFREDPRKFLSRFALGPEEVQMVLTYDVGAMQHVGVNPMLTMGFWQELSPERSMRVYKQRLGATEDQSAAFSAALKG